MLDRGLATLTPTTIGDIGWYQYPEGSTADYQKKMYCDGGADRWLAHVSDGMVFIKMHELDIPISGFAPAESEIELFVGDGYTELELQGKYSTLKPLMSRYWTVYWKLVQLPSGIEVKVGNEELVEFIVSHLPSI